MRNPVTGGEAADYLREIERAFVALRGGPLFLTPADWEVARSWEERGIPLSVALSGIREALSEGGSISTRTPLRRCTRAVEGAFAALRRQAAGAAPPPAEPAADPGGARNGPRRPGEELERLAASLREGTFSLAGAEGEARTAVRAAAGRVMSLAGAVGSGVAGSRAVGSGVAESQAVEDQLAAIERELLARLQAALAPAAREKIEADARRALAGHRTRMPEPVWREAFAGAVRRRVREAFGIPPLTLAG